MARATYNGDGVLVGRGTTSYTQDLVAPLEQVLNDGTTNLVYGLARITSGTGAWYQHDGLGSVRAVLDGAGIVQSTTSYDPWGTPQTALTDSFGFTGELHDGDLVHLRAWWYHPSTGTFTSRDPFAGFDMQPYSLHSYQYAYANPTNYIDPTGLFSQQCDALPDIIPSGPSQCEETIQMIRHIVAEARPKSFYDRIDAGAYGLLTGNYLWNDVVAAVMAMYFMGVSQRTAISSTGAGGFLFTAYSFYDDAQQQSLGEKIGMFQEADGEALWEYSGGMTACDRNLPLHSSINACPAIATDQTAWNRPPSIKAQLEYGFKPDYWSNTHHFMFGFMLGYAGGAFAADRVGEFFENVYTTPPEVRNPVDVQVGYVGSAMGADFQRNRIKPYQLADRIEAVWCLSRAEVESLRRQLADDS